MNTYDNPELIVLDGNMSYLTSSNNRRMGFRNLHRLARYSTSFRSARVLALKHDTDCRIADIRDVRHLTSLPWFSAMVVLKEQDILFEKYASDFSREGIHSIQSISKTLVNLMIGKMVGSGAIDLSRTVGTYIPEIGAGYENATVGQVLNMDVSNDYSEDFSNPTSTYFRHEEAMGWRLPLDSQNELSQRTFLPSIGSGVDAGTGQSAQYKDSNPDVAAWIVERVGGISLRRHIADIVDGAGLEHALHITTDRDGFPSFDGGVCMSARDLARYMSIFARKGLGVSGNMVGDSAFIEETLAGGLPYANYPGVRYSNSMMVTGRSLGHGGWCGQFALANPDTGIVAIVLSVVESRTGAAAEYKQLLQRVLASITNGQLTD